MSLSVGTEAYTQLAENLQKLTSIPIGQFRLSNGRAVSCAILSQSLLLGPLFHRKASQTSEDYGNLGPRRDAGTVAADKNKTNTFGDSYDRRRHRIYCTHAPHQILERRLQHDPWCNLGWTRSASSYSARWD